MTVPSTAPRDRLQAFVFRVRCCTRNAPTDRPARVQEEATLRPATSFALLALLAIIVVAAAVQLARSAAL